jgi:hypothetical protein
MPRLTSSTSAPDETEVSRPGRPFWTGVWTFAANMTALFGIDQIDVTTQPIAVNDWWLAALLSLMVATAVYAKAKVDEINGEKT